MAENDKPEFDKEGIRNVLLVALGVCLVCSIIVSTAAVSLKPQRLLNQQLDQKQNILRAAGMLPQDAKTDARGRGVDELFSEFEVRAVDLDTGEFVDMDVSDYDPIKAAKVAESSRELDSSEDIALIGTRENVSVVYLRRSGDQLEKVVLPVRGYGLWGTLFGYLALEGDLETISGIGFYSHKETPGLGGEVDNPRWKARWEGVSLFDAAGQPAVRLVKVRSAPGSDAAQHEIDALSGATLTTRGVGNLVRFWTGDLGFGPFLKQLHTSG